MSRADQWEHVRPAITDFSFDVDNADVWVSVDGMQAVIRSTWSSMGRTPTGEQFPRGGRATVVVTQSAPSAPWLGRHTHCSREPTGPGTQTAASS